MEPASGLKLTTRAEPCLSRCPLAPTPLPPLPSPCRRIDPASGPKLTTSEEPCLSRRPLASISPVCAASRRASSRQYASYNACSDASPDPDPDPIAATVVSEAVVAEPGSGGRGREGGAPRLLASRRESRAVHALRGVNNVCECGCEQRVRGGRLASRRESRAVHALRGVNRWVRRLAGCELWVRLLAMGDQDSHLSRPRDPKPTRGNQIVLLWRAGLTFPPPTPVTP